MDDGIVTTDTIIHSDDIDIVNSGIIVTDNVIIGNANKMHSIETNTEEDIGIDVGVDVDINVNHIDINMILENLKNINTNHFYYKSEIDDDKNLKLCTLFNYKNGENTVYFSKNILCNKEHFNLCIVKINDFAYLIDYIEYSDFYYNSYPVYLMNGSLVNYMSEYAKYLDVEILFNIKIYSKIDDHVILFYLGYLVNIDEKISDISEGIIVIDPMCFVFLLIISEYSNKYKKTKSMILLDSTTNTIIDNGVMYNLFKTYIRKLYNVMFINIYSNKLLSIYLKSHHCKNEIIGNTFLRFYYYWGNFNDYVKYVLVGNDTIRAGGSNINYKYKYYKYKQKYNKDIHLNKIDLTIKNKEELYYYYYKYNKYKYKYSNTKLLTN
jgi:hypothetical protein